MDINSASTHQKYQWIREGKHIDALRKDSNMWIKITACQRKIVLDKIAKDDAREKLKLGSDADIFEVIQLSAKTHDEIIELILQDKYLTYFSKHPDMGIRIRAKKQMRDYLEEIGSIPSHRPY